MSKQSSASYYRIGTPGKPWGEEERNEWRNQTSIHRSYKNDVLDPIDELKADFDVIQYGALPGYPLFAVKTRDWTDNKPSICITGGVHGYEKSGVKGALLFLKTKALQYADRFNILVFPCVSPWAYEHNERWNRDCKDPNRSFLLDDDKAIPETAAVIKYLQELNVSQWTCHLDLHETTDSDETEYMPARAAAEKGEPYEPEVIPDGFFLYVHEAKAKLDWCRAIIAAVKKVTHIAKPDEDGQICGIPVGSDEGVALLPASICVGDGMSVTKATYHATTELYPDSPQITDDICNQAHVTAITAAMDHLFWSAKTISTS